MTIATQALPDTTVSPGLPVVDTAVDAGNPGTSDLRRKTARGALVSVGGQTANFVVRTGSMIVLARFVSPTDFGLVGMVTAITGFLALFKDAGLSMAAVQRAVITGAEASTLFWLNLAVGGALTLASIGIAPALVSFYGDEKLFWITIALGSGFVLYGATAQHRAMLQRSMRFGAMAIIDVASLTSSVLLGIVFALAGFGYWALVIMAAFQPAATAVGTWLATGWIPGRPRREADIRSLLMFGGALTLNSLLVYIAYNADKVLLGRFWGAEALGIYGRAYQLVTMANESLFTTIGTVAFPALSRLQDDAARLRSYFVKGYGLFLSLVIPVGVWCALFAEDIVLVLLGPKWNETAKIFRWLVPTTIAFGLTNPLSWLMLATGRAGRCLKIALLVTPLLIISFAIGVGFGPTGVAVAFSAAMTVAVVPVVFWAKQGTAITFSDIFGAIGRPAWCAVAGAAATFITWGLINQVNAVVVRLAVESLVFLGTYLLTLLFVAGQRDVYLDLLRDTGLLRRSRPVKAEAVRL